MFVAWVKQDEGSKMNEAKAGLLNRMIDMMQEELDRFYGKNQKRAAYALDSKALFAEALNQIEMIIAAVRKDEGEEINKQKHQTLSNMVQLYIKERDRVPGKEYDDEPQRKQYADDSSAYSDDSSAYADDSSAYADDSSAYADDSSAYADDSSPYSDDSSAYADDSSAYADDSSAYADSSSAYADE